MRGSFRPPGGRFDMQPPSRGVDITTLADWSESVDAGPKVGVGVSAARAMRLGGAGKRFVAARETRAVKALLAAQADARHGVPVVQASAPPSPAKSRGRPASLALRRASARTSRARSPATHFSDDDVSSVAPPKSPRRGGGDGDGDSGDAGGDSGAAAPPPEEPAAAPPRPTLGRTVGRDTRLSLAVPVSKEFASLSLPPAGWPVIGEPTEGWAPWAVEGRRRGRVRRAAAAAARRRRPPPPPPPPPSDASAHETAGAAYGAADAAGADGAGVDGAGADGAGVDGAGGAVDAAAADGAGAGVAVDGAGAVAAAAEGGASQAASPAGAAASPGAASPGAGAAPPPPGSGARRARALASRCSDALTLAALAAAHHLARSPEVLEDLGAAGLGPAVLDALADGELRPDAFELGKIAHGTLALELLVRTYSGDWRALVAASLPKDHGVSSQLVHDGEALSPFLLFLRGAKRALRRCAGDVEATEACAALLHALTAAASDAELAHMLNGEHRVVEALAGADSKRRESQYLRTAIRTGLGNLALANQPTMEELLLRLRGPGAAKTDAELARERMEGAMDDAEKQFMDLPSETHAQNIMDICDRVVKNDKLTISELQIGLDDAVYGEVVAWILGDRHRVFREIDADHSHTLELAEIVRAVDLFKQLREDERAREDYDREMAVREAEDLAAGVARDRARRESYATAKRLRAESAARRRSPAEVAARGIMRHCDVQDANRELTISELQGGLVNTQYSNFLSWLVHRSHFGKFDANKTHTLNLEELTLSVVAYLEAYPDDEAIAAPSRPQSREVPRTPSDLPDRFQNSRTNVRT
ncbi:hypothetical protein SO694_00172041 [Aureococcus anophagefferens]|uniref:Calmodulin n=1 Tax=Aureococcus anophagefferens TaxID=44056 RepID=A0ABR1FH80_AURAN